MWRSRARWIGVVLLMAMSAWGSQAAWSASHHARTGPHRVLIIRHAEKPDAPGDPNLSPRGNQRAAALARTFPDHFPRPDCLIAAKASKESNRPAETLAPLAKALHETIQSDWKDDQFAALAHDLLTDPKFAGKTVLIAWHHSEIPPLAKALGAKDAPPKWDAKVFDRVWEIKYDDGVAKFKDLPQNALPGDSRE